MSVERHVSRPKPQATWRGKWRTRIGEHLIQVSASWRANDPPAVHSPEEPTPVPNHVAVTLDQKFGTQIGDTRVVTMNLERAGAEALRDALTEALAWDGHS